ncbi:MAG: TonB-dependent receptor plug domain-containing protein, partial [Planctomycetota bacterium]|nr:TonB-dependent receptor plug domain-containing protein [Planctomycetota bacterium]
MFSLFLPSQGFPCRVFTSVMILVLGISGLRAQDEDPAAKGEDKKKERVNTTVVIGSSEDILDIPGSGAVLTTEDIGRQSYDDVNQALRKVPGVYVRPEDGFGFFPNISLRGVDTTRSAKVTILEDGVLTAPAAYSAPSAYYTPSSGRMSAIEVLMGSSQTRYGPHTTGGVINYRSTERPDTATTYLTTLYGSNNERRTHAYLGDTFESAEWGRIGILLEGYLRSSDGFKSIDTTSDFQDGEDTGFSKSEPMLKLSWEPKTTRYNRFELKLGYTDFSANEGYTGLTEEDFAANPTRRYAGSRFDQMNSEHSRSYLRHFYELAPETMVTTTLYYNKFHRDWFKLNDVRDSNGDSRSLSQTLAGGGAHLDVLRGEAAGTLRVRHNNRNYRSYGIDTNIAHDHNLLDKENHVNIGIRYHIDNVRRFQTNELFTQDTNGAIIARDPGTPGDAGDRDQTSKALAVYAENEILVTGKLSI